MIARHSLRFVIRSTILDVLWVFDRILYLIGMRATGVAVLMYHSVLDHSWELSVPSDALESHLRLLRDMSYEFLTIQRFQRIIRREEPVPQRSVLITFDDGYRDLLNVALPLLKKYNAPALVFAHASRTSEELGNSLPLLSWEELRHLREAGIAIGAHSFGHANLKTLSAEELEGDFSAANATFLRELGERPSAFAYPGGKFDQQVVDRLRHYGYTCAFTIREGLADPSSDPYHLPRLGIVRGMSLWELRVKLTRVAGWYEALRRIG